MCPVAQKMSQVQTSVHPALFLLMTSPWHTATQFIIRFYWPSGTEDEKIILVCPGAGNLIQLSSVNQRKTSLAWYKSASPPQNLLSRSQKQAVQSSGTISPLSRAAMMSAF